MTQSSEERVAQSTDSPASARVIPFERPQSELQRAVQQRAQERMEAQGYAPKVSKTRRILTFGIALIPVVLIFSGFLVAVKAVRVITSLYARPVETTQPVESVPDAQQPGVVILVPDNSVAQKPAPDAAAPKPATPEQKPTP